MLEDWSKDANLRTKKLNMDPDEVIYTSLGGVSNQPSCGISLFPSNYVATDEDGWKNKPPDEWNESDTKNWLIWVSKESGFAYGRIPCELVIPGRELLTLKRSDLIELDSTFGEKLYDFLRQQSGETSLFPNDGSDTDKDDWESKPVKKWRKSDTQNWLISVSRKLGISYGALPCELGISGTELVRMKRSDFIRCAPTFGGMLYDSLRELGVSGSQQGGKYKDGLKSRQKQSGPARRPLVRRRKPKKKTENVLQFVIGLLHNSQHCPGQIRWEDYEQKMIRFVDSVAIGKLWGKKKNNERMDYKKLTRALRYYRKSGMIVAVNKKRLVYQFGKNVPGLETDDPNFVKLNAKRSS